MLYNPNYVKEQLSTNLLSRNISSSSSAAQAQHRQAESDCSPHNDLVYGVVACVDDNENLAVAVEVEEADETVLCSFNSDGSYLPTGVELDPNFKESAKHMVQAILVDHYLCLDTCHSGSCSGCCCLCVLLIPKEDDSDRSPPPYRTTIGIQETIASTYDGGVAMILLAWIYYNYRRTREPVSQGYGLDHVKGSGRAASG